MGCFRNVGNFNLFSTRFIWSFDNMFLVGFIIKNAHYVFGYLVDLLLIGNSHIRINIIYGEYGFRPY